jgi:hypothetical protein
MTDFESRLAALEVSVRRWKAASVSAVAVAAGAMAVLAAKPGVAADRVATAPASTAPTATGPAEADAVTDLVRTRKIVVENDAGTPVVILTALKTGDGAGVFRTSEGKEGVGVLTGREGSSLTVHHAGGKQGIVVATHADGEAYVSFRNAAGKIWSRVPK